MLKHRIGSVGYKLLLITACIVGIGIATSLYNTKGVHADGNCTISYDLVNSCRPWFGAATRGNPGTPGTLFPKTLTNDSGYQFTYLESLLGQQLDIYRGYDTCSQGSTGAVSCTVGTIPFSTGSPEQTLAQRPNTYTDINWKPSSNWADADGGNATINSEITQVAQNIKALAPNKVFLTMWHEPQNDVSAFDNSAQQNACTSSPSFKGLVGSAGTPAQYVAAWQNVENIFAQQGATNVVWVADYQGTPNGQWDCLLQPLWPGNNRVDWVTYDTYSGTTFKTWEQTVGRMYTVLQQESSASTNFVSKPWGVAEFGDCNSNDDSQIGQYFGNAQSEFRANTYPNLKMYLVYANTGNAAGPGCLTDYDANGTYDTTKQSDFNQFANAVLGSTTPLDTIAPSIPNGLAATAVSSHEIDLTWQASTDNVGVAGYTVYRNGVQIARVTDGSTTYADTGLPDGTSYQYTVAAIDTAGNVSAQTNATNAMTPDGTPPSTPSSLTASLSAPDTVTLGWQASTDNVGVAGYTVYRNGTPIGTVKAGVTTYVDSGLSDITTYQYTVTAYDAAGNVSPSSATASITTSDTTPPTVPTGLTATAVSGHEIDLSWQSSTDNVGVAGYALYRDGAFLTLITSANTYADTGLPDGTSYQYTVTAYDAAGNVSAPTNPVGAFTPDVTAPSTPNNVQATPTGPNQIALSWDASADNVGVAGYHVYRNGALTATLNNDVTTYVDTGLTDATSYAYTVDAYDAAGNISSQSAGTSATTPDTTPPTVPTGLTATAVSGHEIDLSWQSSTDNVGVAGYYVYRNGIQVATITAATGYADLGLGDGSTYQYTVDAYDAAGNISSQSSAVSATTPDLTPPNTPTSLQATFSTGSITLSWSASTDNVGVTGYQIYRNGLLLGTTIVPTYVDTTAVQGTSYQYTVTAYDAAGNVSQASAPLALQFPDATPPTIPGNFNLTLSVGKNITLSWSASTDNVGVTGYQIYRNGVKVARVTKTSYVDTTVVQGHNYVYTVAAYDAAGNMSAQTNSLSMIFPDITSPTQPTNLKLTPSIKSIALSWSASTDNVGVTGYKIYRGSALITTVSGSTTTYTDKNLKSGTSYSYYIIAVDGAGNQSTASASVSAKAL